MQIDQVCGEVARTITFSAGSQEFGFLKIVWRGGNFPKNSSRKTKEKRKNEKKQKKDRVLKKIRKTSALFE